MQFHPFLLVLSFSIYSVESVHLSPEENEELQRTCGLGAEGPIPYIRRIVNHDPLGPSDLPYVAMAYTQKDNGKVMLAPATIISPRHLVVWNTVRYNWTSAGWYVVSAFPFREGAMQCLFDELIMPLSHNNRFDYDFKFTEDHPGIRKFEPTVERVIVFKGCADNYELDGETLMILELKENIKAPHSPVCLSDAPENWDMVSHFIMHGIGTDLKMGVAAIGPIECGEDVKQPLSCAENVNKKQGLCTGDFGGGAVGTLNNRATLYGTYAVGNLNCSADTKKNDPYKFINIGYFTEQICQITGICVPEVSRRGITALPNQKPVDKK